MTLRHSRRSSESSAPHFPPAPVTPRLYRNIALTFLGLTIAVVILVVWMSSVKATVRVHVKRDPANVELAVDIAKQPTTGELRGRVVQGPFDNILEFNVKEQATSTAVALVATTTGRVRITNNYSKAQPLIQRTRLLTPGGKLFRITSTINVPPGSSVEVEAVSDQPGSEYAVKKGTAFTIPGLWVDLQKLIFAEAITDFTGTAIGGAARRIVTQTDVDSAYASLQEGVVEKAKKLLMAEAGIGPEQVGSTCPANGDCWEAVYLVAPLEKKTNISPGQPSESFLAQVKVNVTGVFYPKKDMDALLRTKLKERLPEGRELIGFGENQATYRLERSDAETEKARIQASVQAFSRLTAQSPSLSKEALLGLSIEEAKDTFAGIEGVEFIEVTLRPSWARRLPSQQEKIDLRIE